MEHELLKLVGDATESNTIRTHGHGIEEIEMPAATIRRNKGLALKVQQMQQQQQQQQHNQLFDLSHSSTTAAAPSTSENEFALELLHIMRTSSTFLG